MFLSKRLRWTIYTIIIVGVVIGGWYLTATERPDHYMPGETPYVDAADAQQELDQGQDEAADAQEQPEQKQEDDVEQQEAEQEPPDASLHDADEQVDE